MSLHFFIDTADLPSVPDLYLSIQQHNPTIPQEYFYRESCRSQVVRDNIMRAPLLCQLQQDQEET
jgi:hypothetical protein